MALRMLPRMITQHFVKHTRVSTLRTRWFFKEEMMILLEKNNYDGNLAVLLRKRTMSTYL